MGERFGVFARGGEGDLEAFGEVLTLEGCVGAFVCFWGGRWLVLFFVGGGGGGGIGWAWEKRTFDCEGWAVVVHLHDSALEDGDEFYLGVGEDGGVLVVLVFFDVWVNGCFGKRRTFRIYHAIYPKGLITSE